MCRAAGVYDRLAEFTPISEVIKNIAEKARSRCGNRGPPPATGRQNVALHNNNARHVKLQILFGSLDEHRWNLHRGARNKRGKWSTGGKHYEPSQHPVSTFNACTESTDISSPGLN